MNVFSLNIKDLNYKILLPSNFWQAEEAPNEPSGWGALLSPGQDYGSHNKAL